LRLLELLDSLRSVDVIFNSPYLEIIDAIMEDLRDCGDRWDDPEVIEDLVRTMRKEESIDLDAPVVSTSVTKEGERNVGDYELLVQ
jgi:hypothetical protein